MIVEPPNADIPDILEIYDKVSETMLDVGCGECPITRAFDIPIKIGIEVCPDAIPVARKYCVPLVERIQDVIKLFGEKSIDLVVLFDIVEHFEKDYGERLLDKCIKIAKRQVLVWTPLGFHLQEELSGNEYQKHLSGWDVEDFSKRDFVTEVFTNRVVPMIRAIKVPEKVV